MPVRVFLVHQLNLKMTSLSRKASARQANAECRMVNGVLPKSFVVATALRRRAFGDKTRMERLDQPSSRRRGTTARQAQRGGYSGKLQAQPLGKAPVNICNSLAMRHCG